eukprot:CAMPEP_0180808932 /NCGR_PEP_ID=MMETSP1038_2-20121128/64062_1 /TAXON_ID=632150 /ORGANISM="Azadinium spinosum, Strain 3D9" /LENGTH=46 /DNA_ID= /DNA_START= /DNA_END= /DNA_ORIENTATION=
MVKSSPRKKGPSASGAIAASKSARPCIKDVRACPRPSPSTEFNNRS